MPPKLGKPRAQLSKEFLAVLTKFHYDKINHLQQEIKKGLKLVDDIAIPHLRSAAAREVKQNLATLKTLEDHKGDARSAGHRGGLEYDIMRLKRMSYVNFAIKDRTGGHPKKRQIWMVGRTREIETLVKFGVERGRRYHAIETTRDDRDAIYNFGSYFICLNIATFGQSTPYWHLIPVTNWDTTNRHMHHTATAVRGDNPLDWPANTCWGAFSGIAQALWIDGDIVELFNILYQFAARMNPRSPLIPIGSMPHVRKVEDEAVHNGSD